MKREIPFDPRNDAPYPEYTDGNYLPFGDTFDMVFDENYPYVDLSPEFKKKQRRARLLLNLLVFPFSYVRLGLRIRGKKNIKNNKALLKQGAVSVCNHVNRWDYIAIMNAIRPFKPYILVNQQNIATKDGELIRQVGGIPIPEGNYKATLAYLKAVKEMLEKGGWLHLYPEGSMWEFYRPIRPLKRGAAYIARVADKPIVPLAISYRKPTWIRKKLFHQKARITLNIGAPIFIDKSIAEPRAQEIDLLKRVHAAMTALAGLSENENVYEAVFDNSKRIDY